MLIIAPHRHNRSPSQRFRFEQFLPYLEQNGFEITLSNIIDEKADKHFYKPGNYLRKLCIVASGVLTRLRDAARSRKFDVIFIQREAFMAGPAFFERLIALFKKQDTKIVFDFDDAIWIEDTSSANKNLAWLKSPQKIATTLKLADKVFAGNEYLNTYAKSFTNNSIVVPTTIDTDLFFPRPQSSAASNEESKPIIIGWTGSPTTIRHLKTILPVFKTLSDKYADKISFRFIGDPTFRDQVLNISGIRWRAESEVIDLHPIDIGVMPLTFDKWSEGKCGCKALQYMAIGIPAVASAVGVNKSIIDHGQNGFLVHEFDEWETILTQLIDDSSLRSKIGKNGRETVIQKYSVKAWRNTYLENLRKS